MTVIGLTGGIASGKSTVSEMLKELGAEIIDADKIAREIVKPGKGILDRIVENFGIKILKHDGTLNRKALGDIVFGDEEKLKLLNRITHPEIRRLIVQNINNIKMRSSIDKIIVVDAAILLECGMDELVDEVWLVYIDYETQLERLIFRDKLSRTQAEDRIRSQMPVEEKMRRSQRIILNTKDIEYTKEQVLNLWHQVRNNGGSPIAPEN